MPSSDPEMTLRLSLDQAITGDLELGLPGFRRNRKLALFARSQVLQRNLGPHFDARLKYCRIGIEVDRCDAAIGD